MKTTLVLASITDFASKINAMISESQLALSFNAFRISHQMASCAVNEMPNLSSLSGSPLEVKVVTGTAAAITAQLADMVAGNPYWSVVATHPLQKIQTETTEPEEATDATKPAPPAKADKATKVGKQTKADKDAAESEPPAPAEPLMIALLQLRQP